MPIHRPPAKVCTRPLHGTVAKIMNPNTRSQAKFAEARKEPRTDGLLDPGVGRESLHHLALRECHSSLLKDAQCQLNIIFVEYEEKLSQLLQDAMHEQKTVGIYETEKRLKHQHATVESVSDLSDAAMGTAEAPPQPSADLLEVEIKEETAGSANPSSDPTKNSHGETIPLGQARGGVLSIHADGDDFGRKIYKVEHFYKQTGWAQRLARSDLFSQLTLSFIASNAMYLGIDADLNTAEMLIHADLPWIICENIFCVFFTCEIIVRFSAFAIKRDSLQDDWFKFDSCLVILMIFEVWGMMLLSFMGYDEGLSAIPTAPLRLLRLLRLSRLIRLLRALPELVTMIKGMRIASRAVASSALMVIFLVYVFSIVMLTTCSGLIMGDDEISSIIRAHLGNLPLCMWTMLMEGTFMLETSVILTALRDSHTLDGYLAMCIFIAFMLLSALTVLNMLIGVLCEVVTTVGQQERDDADIALVKIGILRELQKFDQDGNGTITRLELDHVMGSEQAQAVLDDLEVNQASLEQIHAMLFADPSATVPILTIMQNCLNYRGSQMPTVKHLVDGMVFNRHFTERILQESMDKVNRTVISQNQAIITALEKYDAEWRL